MHKLHPSFPANDSAEDFTDSDDLLHSLTDRVRILTLGAWDDSVIGVILEENNDSFLVALPATVLNIEGNIYLKEINTGMDPFIRLLKSGVRAVASAPATHESMYVEIIARRAPEVFPELLEMVGLQSIEVNEPFNDDDEAGLEEVFNDISDITGVVVNPPKAFNSEAGGVVITPRNVTNSEVEEKVRKAQAAGFFIPINEKSKN